MQLALFSALEAAAVVALVVVVLRLSRVYALVARVRLSVCAAGFLLAVLLLERRLSHPGKESISTAALAALVLVVLHVLLQVADHVVWERFLKPRHISVPRLLFDILNFVVLATVGVALLKTLYAVNLTGFLVTSTVLSAILGLSLQDVLTSMMSGIALQIENPVSVREWVRIGDKEGEVVQMNWRTITLRAREGHHVVLPNARVAKEDILNFSRPQAHERLHVTVGVSYAHPPGEVKAVLASAAAAAEGVSPSPPPEALVTGFGDSAIQYELRFWVTDFEAAPVTKDAVLGRAWYALRRAGMAVPLPQREVAVRQVSDAHEEERLGKLRQESFDVLRAVETFRPLTDEQIRHLVRSARMERYAAGERLVRQGEEGRSLFVIKSGEVSVERSDGNAPARELARLGPGRFFGEMSLLTGEPRTATVRALGELEVAVVDKEAFADVILTDTRLVQALSEVLEHRSREDARQAQERDQAEPLTVTEPGSFFLKIQRFFGVEG